MSMRIFNSATVISIVGSCLVTGCGTSTGDVPAGDRMDCAVEGSELANVCTVEKGAGILTIHHPDGGFRRLIIDGKGALSAADGADIATTEKRADGRTVVQIGRDRYVFGHSAPGNGSL
jgi:hypothetical protein